MIPEKHVREYLQHLQKSHGRGVYGRLEKGDTVTKSFGSSYEIDDPEIVSRIGNYPNGQIPLTEIYRHFRFPLTEKECIHTECELIKLLRDEGIELEGKDELVAPYSRPFNLGLGECTELGIAGQLFAQRGRDAFLINGLFSDSDVGSSLHTYNVVYKDGKPFIVDMACHNGVDSRGKTIAYIAPVIGIDKAEREFIVPKEHRHGRAYLIF